MNTPSSFALRATLASAGVLGVYVFAAQPPAPRDGAGARAQPAGDMSTTADQRRRAAATPKADPVGTGPLQASGPSLMKPGFNFNPSTFPSLAGYAIVPGTDDIHTNDLALGLTRRLDLFNIGANVRLRITIGVSHVSASAALAFFEGFTLPSEMQASERLVSADSIGVSIGDDPISESLVSANSDFGVLRDEAAFRRKNIFVSIQYVYENGPADLDLTDIATEIDAAVAAIPDVSFAAFELARPIIDGFSAVTPNLAEGQISDLNVLYHDPNWPLVSVDRLYIEDDGDVISGTDKYRAGSLIGSQNLTLVVYNPNLLFREATIAFNVTP